MCACVCEWKREIEVEIERECVCMCVCVCAGKDTVKGSCPGEQAPTLRPKCAVVFHCCCFSKGSPARGFGGEWQSSVASVPMSFQAQVNPLSQVWKAKAEEKG